MATVRVSFLIGGERFHGRLNRSSVLSDVPAKATRVNRAGPGYKVIWLRRLSHTPADKPNAAPFSFAIAQMRFRIEATPMHAKLKPGARFSRRDLGLG